MKGGISGKLITLALDRDLWPMSREMDIKLCKIHTKIHIYAAELPPIRVQYTVHVFLSVPCVSTIGVSSDDVILTYK